MALELGIETQGPLSGSVGREVAGLFLYSLFRLTPFVYPV